MIIVCNTCLEFKDEECFKKDNRRQFIPRNGRHTTCKDCENKASRTRYDIIPDDSLIILTTFRTCTSCLQTKTLNFFSKSHSAPFGRTYYCKTCNNQKAKEKRRRRGLKKTPNGTSTETNSDRYRKYKYGLDREAYLKLYNDHDGRCDICHRPLELISKFTCVDHCHTSGIVRGLLCGNCNSAIGMVYENISILDSAIQYINKHQHLKDTKETK